MMDSDEEATLARWLAVRATLTDPQIRTCRGRIVKSTGDGLLVEFTRAVDAVRCAIEIQRDMTAANLAPDNPVPMNLRIAVNLADIVDAEDDIYGSGVNIAARLQQFAEPGGIVISAAVRDQIAEIDDITTVEIGPLRLKNIDRSIVAYRVIDPALNDRPRTRGTTTLPSLAVLPFSLQSELGQDRYFVEGLLDEIVSILTGVAELVVISRSTTLAYQDRDAELRTVAEQLGARYVVLGRAHRANGHFAMTLELADTQTNQVLWSRLYNLQAADLFTVQEDVSRRIAGALIPNLQSAEMRRVLAKRPENMDAYDLVLQAMYFMHRLGREDLHQAGALLERAIALDPSYGTAYSLLAELRTHFVGQGYSPGYEEVRRVLTLASQATTCNPTDARALALMGHAKSWLAHDYDAALELFDTALGVAPNSVLAWTYSSPTYSYIDQPETAISHAEYALRLSPLDPHGYVMRTALTLAHYTRGDYGEAIKWGRRAVATNPTYLAGLRILCASLAASGELDEASDVARKMLAVKLDFTVGKFIASYAYRDPARNEQLGRHLVRAGLPW